MDFKQIKQRQYIIDWIKKEIHITKNEKPVYAFLCSTDRKGYIIEYAGTYQDKEYKSLVRVQPFEDGKEVIDRVEEEIRHKLSEMVYNDIFNSNQ